MAWTRGRRLSPRRLEWPSDSKRVRLWDAEAHGTHRSIYDRRKRRTWLLPVVALFVFLIFMLVLQPVVMSADDSSSRKYNRIYSRMTPDGKYFPMDFGDFGSYNPNLIPHPHKNDTWFMIAQALQIPGESSGGPVYSQELVCEATYRNGTMKCNRSPLSLPVASTASPHCTENLEWFNLFIGPNDPRVFLGPDKPYITYGSASHYTCLGQWIHDLRRLVNWDSSLAIDPQERFFYPTELKRPGTFGKIEKNFFAFWDAEGDLYLHYDLSPQRSFARVDENGTTVSDDLAPAAAKHDKKCLERYMPKTLPKEHIHQATNSLAITMCSRGDESCDHAKNTYIMTIFHHKVYYGHNLYEPYVMLFKNSAPFQMHAIASKPFWINGRGEPGETDDPDVPEGDSEMMYITSMSWKDRNQTYHGYLDDQLMISFGIEDKASGGIDVLAKDLVRDYHVCW